MKTAILHFADGRNETQEIAVPYPQTIELGRGSISLITRTFEYRIDQPEDAVSVDYDEVVAGTDTEI